jgi:hypothetical protein
MPDAPVSIGEGGTGVHRRVLSKIRQCPWGDAERWPPGAKLTVTVSSHT